MLSLENKYQGALKVNTGTEDPKIEGSKFGRRLKIVRVI